MAENQKHHVKVGLIYTNGEKRTPYKWYCECKCGWRALSWSWDRRWDMARSNLSPEEWVRDNGEPSGGAFVMALDHVGLAS